MRRLPDLALRPLRVGPSALQRGCVVFLGLGVLSLAAVAVLVVGGQGPGLVPGPLAALGVLALGLSWVVG